MSAEAFVDTNILLYAASGKQLYPEKHRCAWDVISEGNYAISGQVLAEFYVNSQKAKATQTALTQEETSAWIERLCLLPIVPIDHTVVQMAIQHSNRYKISYWDAALVAAAETMNLPVIYTEDLNDGQLYGSVTAINPFKKAA
jgi:predicted nucleic acid-binding protein